jgi:hypothetical protein
MTAKRFNPVQFDSKLGSTLQKLSQACTLLAAAQTMIQNAGPTSFDSNLARRVQSALEHTQQSAQIVWNLRESTPRYIPG